MEFSTTAPSCPHSERSLRSALSQPETSTAPTRLELRRGLRLVGLLLGGIGGSRLRPGLLGIQPTFENVGSWGAWFGEGSIPPTVSKRGLYQAVNASARE